MLSCAILDAIIIDSIICKYFLPFSRLSFHFVNDFLCCEIKSHLLTFAFASFALGDRSKKKKCYDLCQRACCLFSSFIVSGLMFRSLIYFKLIFGYDLQECCNFTLLHELSTFLSTTYWRHCIVYYYYYFLLKYSWFTHVLNFRYTIKWLSL